MPFKAPTLHSLLAPKPRPKDPRGKKKYDRRAWRDRLRPMKLSRDALCAHCLKAGQVVAANEINHIDGDSSNDAWNNLESLCKPCHSRVTVREHYGFGRAPKAKGGAKSD